MKRERVVYLSLFVLAAAMLACDSDPFLPGETSSSDSVGTMRVLFVGNSATYTNGLPAMVQDMGSAGSVPIETVDESEGGVDLDFHWHFGSARDALDNGRWNVVVLQGGAGETFEEYAVIWANAIRAVEARPALYMFCAAPPYLDDFDDLRVSYRTAAEEARAELYAAAEACMAAWSIDPDLPLSEPDGHPSVMGSYLAALTIYRGITGREPPSLTNLGISAEDDAVLQAAAAAVQPISH
ncbi:MAG: hypothetical protein JSW71_05085 [Gemmatimonadota bacterium]|nr:MAG: hypothetical protein JSW71_05085 [Gemmatimonadota bacterium]